MMICKCGCKKEVLSKRAKWFIHGHNAKGRVLPSATWDNLRKIRIGSGNPMFGKKSSEKQKASARIRLIKDNPMKKKEISALFSGKNCHLWRGGITPINLQIRNSTPYKEWRKSVFERDHYICQLCYARSGNGVTVILHADHIKPFSLFPDLRFELSNGRTLCKNCHRKTDTYGGRVNKFNAIHVDVKQIG